MANPKHKMRLEKSVTAWNQWRQENPTIKPDLEGVELWLTDLRGIDLSNTNLRNARLFATNLRKANLRWCDLRGAVVHGAQDEPVDLRDCKLTRSDWRGADVRRIRYNNQMSCAGIRVTDCYGSQRFIRHVLDLAYLEEFEEEHPIPFLLWSITTSCGRSWLRLLGWCCFILCLFALVFMYLGTSYPLITSIMAFTSFGFVEPTQYSPPELLFICIEVVLGYTLFGALVALIANRMGRRS